MPKAEGSLPTADSSIRVPLVAPEVVRAYLLRFWLACAAIGTLFVITVIRGGLVHKLGSQPQPGMVWYETPTSYLALVIVVPAGLLLLFALDRARTVLVFSPDGLVVERGRRRWALPWSECAGYCWERDQDGALLALTLRTARGTDRRINLAWVPSASAARERILAALQNCGAAPGELAEVRRTTPPLLAIVWGVALIGGVLLLFYAMEHWAR